MSDSREADSYYRLWKLSIGAEMQDVLACAVELGLFTALAEQPLTVSQIAEALNLRPRPAEVLTVACAAMGVLQGEDGRYGNVPRLEDFLVEGGPMYNHYTAFGPAGYANPERGAMIKQTLLTDQPQSESFWLNPAERRKMARAAFYPHRHNLRVRWGERVARAFDFTPFHKVVDLGGATGGHLVGIVRHFPHLEGVVLDLEYNQSAAEEALALTDKTGRVRFRSGDFFADELPANTDVFFLSHILHDWGRKDCVRLLRRCYGALPPEGTVVAAEFLLNEEKTGPLLAAFQGLHVFYYSREARQWTGSEIREMMAEAGLAESEVRPIDQEQSIIVAWKN